MAIPSVDPVNGCGVVLQDASIAAYDRQVEQTRNASIQHLLQPGAQSVISNKMNNVGRQVAGTAAIIMGIFILVWGDFAGPWENVPLSGALRQWLAYLIGAILIVAGASLFWRRTSRLACLVLAAIFLGFAGDWIGAIVRAPAVYNSWGCFAEMSSITAGFLALFASLAEQTTDNMARLALASRLWFGVCSISFAAVHFITFSTCAKFVPSWMPLGGAFWAAATGVAHLMVAVAILSGVWALTASRLAALMYLAFGVLGWGTALIKTWGTPLATPPNVHFMWGGVFVTLVLVAAVWMVGDSLVTFPSKDGERFVLKGSL